MSEHDDPAVEPSFDDPSYDELRALLASARVTDPVPDDVAARLDATLESMQVTRAIETDSRTNVVPLRHRLGRVLVAAAAVVVIGAGGVGIAQLAGNTGSNDDATAGSAAAPSEAWDDAGGSGAAETPQSAPGVTAAKAVPQLTTTHFARDAARLMSTAYLSAEIPSPAPTGPATGTDGSLDGLGYEAPPVTATPERADALADKDLLTCSGPEAPDAIVQPATLDGALVALLFRPPTAHAQRVEAWSCDGTTLLASALIRH